jgi:hypothetical protein
MKDDIRVFFFVFFAYLPISILDEVGLVAAGSYFKEKL